MPRVALITTSTPEPVYGNGTAATRSHARPHPEGTLFLGFLLALLVGGGAGSALSARRLQRRGVLLPDERMNKNIVHATMNTTSK